MLVYHDGQTPAFSSGIKIADNLNNLINWYLSKRIFNDELDGKMKDGLFLNLDNNKYYYMSDVLEVYFKNGEVNLSKISCNVGPYDVERIEHLNEKKCELK